MNPISSLISDAIFYITANKIDVYTFSLYFDTESVNELTICVDTKENSALSVKKFNASRTNSFREYLARRDFGMLSVCNLMLGRNTELGDYAHVNIAAIELTGGFIFDESFILDSILKITERQGEICGLSSDPDNVIFTCSTKDDEFGLHWARI